MADEFTEGVTPLPGAAERDPADMTFEERTGLVQMAMQKYQIGIGLSWLTKDNVAKALIDFTDLRAAR
jgi:hypothetical protein